MEARGAVVLPPRAQRRVLHNGVPAIVTPWMPGGNITEYLEKHADTNRLKLASSSVLPASAVGSLCVLSPCSFTT